MEHAYTTDTRRSGIWTAGGDVYCRWRWLSDTGELMVEAGDLTRCWRAPDLDHASESGIELDLAETARDVAHLLRRSPR